MVPNKLTTISETARKKMKLSKSYRNSHDKVMKWINNSTNDFTLPVCQDGYFGKEPYDGNSSFSEDSEFLSVSQQCDYYVEKQPIKHHINERKVYKSCVKPTRKQLKFRQLPKLFDDVTCTDNRAKQKQSKSLADLNIFINSINTKKGIVNIERKSTNETLRSNSPAQHYLSPNEDSSYRKPVCSQSSVSEVFSHSESDWSYDVDLEHVFSKRKKYRKRLKYKNTFKLHSRQNWIVKGKQNNSEWAKTSITEDKRSYKSEQQQTAFKTFRLKSLFNNHFVHKAKSIQQANEIYNKYMRDVEKSVNKSQKRNKISTNIMKHDVEQQNDDGTLSKKGTSEVQQCNMNVCDIGLNNCDEEEIDCKCTISKPNVDNNSMTNEKANNTAERCPVVKNIIKGVYTQLKIVDKSNIKKEVRKITLTKVNRNKSLTNRKRRKNIKLLNRNSILQSPGWSKLVEKMKELNVRDYKLRMNYQDVSVLSRPNKYNVGIDNTSNLKSNKALHVDEKTVPDVSEDEDSSNDAIETSINKQQLLHRKNHNVLSMCNEPTNNHIFVHVNDAFDDMPLGTVISNSDSGKYISSGSMISNDDNKNKVFKCFSKENVDPRCSETKVNKNNSPESLSDSSIIPSSIIVIRNKLSTQDSYNRYNILKL